MQPDDFVRVPVEPRWQRNLYIFDLSERIRNGLPNNNDLKQRLRAKLVPIAERIGNTARGVWYPPESINFVFENSLYEDDPEDTYRITIQGGRLTIEIPAWNRFPRPEVIDRIKEAIADVVLAEPRKAFVKGKTMTRVAQSVGLNDPLAVKEITKFLGGRKSRKSKRTNKKTLKRHNGGRR
jgi:hypothetical protein